MRSIKESHIFALILFFILILLAFIFILPQKNKSLDSPLLPWLININQQGKLRVFNITLEETTLSQGRDIFQKEEELTLFKKGKEYALEAYFGQTNLNGLKGDFIFTLALQPNQAKALYEKGIRISQMKNGEHKITLSKTDFPMIDQLKVEFLTYIPSVNLKEIMILNRFGKPSEKIREEKSQIVHWLYPKKGLDIAVSEKTKEVLQYITPARFNEVTQQLK